MDAYRANDPYGNGHEGDREALRRARTKPVRKSTPPAPGLGLTTQSTIVMGVIFTLLSAWAATVAAKAWGVAVPAAFLLLVGGLMLAAGSIWKSALVWDEMPYGHGVGFHYHFLFPVRFFHSMVVFTDFERFKEPLILMAKGMGLMALGYLLDAMLSGPPA